MDFQADRLFWHLIIEYTEGIYEIQSLRNITLGKYLVL